ncbi:heterokaryon incompatibility protein-domain-containing protein [Cubamyces lactineus]|nr:heterokaryon incompatibility protein-domain-containing protein [Cubamyces lactineus]
MALPHRPRSICGIAWKGVFARRFGIFSDPVEHYRDSARHCLCWTGGYEYTISSATWLKCAHSGCLWCRFLKDQFLDDLKEQSDEPWPVPRVHIRVGCPPRERPDSELLWEEIFVVVNDLGRSFQVYSAEDSPVPWVDSETKSRIPYDEAPDVLAAAATYIKQCVRDHPQCQAITPYPVGSAPLPTRLLDCSNPDRLRIIETDSSMRDSYVALSYVWGPDGQPHRTTKANLPDYMRRIKRGVLPRTIRDAIRVTRALGARYLWIDSLCIIQDSKEDVHRELARMRDVYRHALLTIDACSAANVSEGFLKHQRLCSEPVAMLPFIDFVGGSARVGKAYWTDPSSDEPDVHVTRNNKETPTSHTEARGWCLQERMLSTRSLVFKADALHLRCHTETRNVGGDLYEETWEVPRLPDATFHDKRRVSRESDEWKEILETWWKILHDYSTRSLSSPSDKLVAIAGLAEMFASTLGPDYLAGLWRDSLFQDLLWQRTGRARACSAPSRYRAPSWSWASVDGQTKHGMIDEPAHYLAEVVECTVKLLDKKLPFGQVVGGSLVLSANFLRGKWDDSGSVTIEPPTQGPRRAKSPKSRSLPAPGPEDRLVFVCDTDRDEDGPGQELWVLPLVEDDAGCVQGIVVTPTERDIWPSAGSDDRRDVYRRVGYCFAFRDDLGQTRKVIRQYPKVVVEVV